MNRKFLGLFSLLVIIIFITACSSSKNIQVEKEVVANAPLIIDPREIKAGEQIGDLTISHVAANDAGEEGLLSVVHFTGEVTVSGHLTIHDRTIVWEEGWGLGNFFTPLEDKNPLPVLFYEPDRIGFTIVDNEAHALSNLETGDYEATLVIKNYEIWAQGKGQENRAELVDITTVNRK